MVSHSRIRSLKTPSRFVRPYYNECHWRRRRQTEMQRKRRHPRNERQMPEKPPRKKRQSRLRPPMRWTREPQPPAAGRMSSPSQARCRYAITFARSSPDRNSIRKPAHLSQQGATTTRRSPQEWRPPRLQRLRKCWSGALPPPAPPARAAPRQHARVYRGPSPAQAAPRPCRQHRPFPPLPRQRFHPTCARWFHRQIYR